MGLGTKEHQRRRGDLSWPSRCPATTPAHTKPKTPANSTASSKKQACTQPPPPPRPPPCQATTEGFAESRPWHAAYQASLLAQTRSEPSSPKNPCKHGATNSPMPSDAIRYHLALSAEPLLPDPQQQLHPSSGTMSTHRFHGLVVRHQSDQATPTRVAFSCPHHPTTPGPC